jgi:hypothetical protein
MTGRVWLVGLSIVGLEAAGAPSQVLAQQGRRLQVVDRDTQLGVKSVIEVIDPKNVPSRVGPTDGQGFFLLTLDCRSGYRVKASPESRQYFLRIFECPPSSSTLPLQRILYMQRLDSSARALESQGRPEDAAVAYNELAVRLRVRDPEAAARAELKTYSMFGMLVGVAETARYDPLQMKLVMSPQLEAGVLKYQTAKGLRRTGVIDHATLASAANRSVSDLIFDSGVP